MSAVEMWFLKQVLLLEIIPFNLMRFFWQTSVVIIAVWLINRTVFRESSVIKSLLWRCTFYLIPLFLLFSGIFDASNSIEIPLPFDRFVFTEQNNVEKTETTINSSQTISQKSSPDGIIIRCYQNIIEHKSTLLFFTYFAGFFPDVCCLICKLYSSLPLGNKGNCGY